MDINMTLLLALSVLLASRCHLAAPEFFVRDLGAGVFLDTFLFLLHWGQLSRGGILSLCFKDRSQSSFHAVWGGWEYWKLGSCPLFPLELFPSFHQNIRGTLLGFPQWGKGGIGALLGFPPVRQRGEEGGNIEGSCCLSCKDGAPYPCPQAKVNKWVFTFFI